MISQALVYRARLNDVRNGHPHRAGEIKNPLRIREMRATLAGTIR